MACCVCCYKRYHVGLYLTHDLQLLWCIFNGVGVAIYQNHERLDRKPATTVLIMYKLDWKRYNTIKLQLTTIWITTHLLLHNHQMKTLLLHHLMTTLVHNHHQHQMYLKQSHRLQVQHSSTIGTSQLNYSP